MKKINLISRLLSYSHEKQSPQRFGRYAVMLIMLLTLGVGQMWGTDRTFVSDQVIYFKDVSSAYNWGGGSSYWGQYGGVYAYFFDAEEKNAWATASAFDGSAGEANRIYSITVPKLNGISHTWTTVIFTRGDGASWSNKWQQTTNQTTEVSYNLFYISATKSGDNFTGSWGRYSPYGAVVGDANDWNPDSNPFSSGSSSTINVSIPYADYTFKVLYKEAYYGCNTSITNSISDWTFAADQGDCTLKPAVADAAKNYEFTWKSGTKKLSVSYPTSYTITYDVGTCKGSSSVTVSPNFTSGGLVEATTDVTFTKASTKNGYNWEGWWSNPGGTGTEHSSTDANLSWTATRTGNISVYACYSLITYNITYHLNSGSGASDRTYNVETATITLPTPTRTGYTFGGWYANSSLTGAAVTSIPKGSYGDKEYWAKWTAKTYDVILDVNGATSGSDQTVVATYDAAMPTKQKTSGDDITAPSKTGYNFDGYTASDDGTGTKYYTSALASNHIWDVATDETHIYAKWNPKSCDIVFDFDESDSGYGSKAGASTGTTATYDADMTSVTPPTAANGYAFMGYYTAADGGGTQYYDGSGNSVTTWAENTESETTLYAYYKQAEITAISLSDAVVAPGEDITTTPTVSPTPTGTTIICWRVLYSNDNPLESQPSFSPAQGNVYDPEDPNAVTFAAPATSGMYKIEAVLRTGSSCGGGTELSTIKQSFQVAGSHSVTVQYKDASGNVIKASGSVTGRPLAWSEEAITAPDIFGYTFARWEAGDGVTISTDGTNPIVGTSTTTRDIYIKAVYDGRLTAVYNKKSMIYFKNTLGWENVYFHNSYWDNSQGGAGNKGQTRNQSMSLVPGETDIYYWEGTPGTNVAFTNATYGDGTTGDGGYQSFWVGGDGAAVVFPSNPACSSSANTYYGYNAGTPMFVPIEQDAITFNEGGSGKALYYNKGYWRYYDPVNGEAGSTGYTLKIYNKTENDGREELSSTSFTNANVSGQLFKATVNLEAAGGYGVKILRNNSMLYTNIEGHLQRTGDVVVTERENDNYKAIWIKATAAGDYDFIITCNGDGKICLQATFPAKSGDYRVLYTDNATWSNSAHTAQSWNHPSRVISAEANAEDTISFYVAKGNAPQYKIEKITGIDEGTGAITWTQVQGWTDISVDATGVYNFKITQNAAGDGISSVTNIGEYSGNYYIRTDCAGSTKWDNYKTADHMMTYSEYSKEHSDYTHYYMKFVESGTNVKFTIANDYSACISDTIITHNYRGGDASYVYAVAEEGHKAGDIMADANIRFMWDIRYNKLIRAYLARGKNDGSKFLVLAGTDSDNILDPSGNVLSDETNNNHTGGDHCMQFVDNENWIYETNVKIVPSSYVKLTALFNGSTFYFKGSAGAFDETHAIKLIEGSGDAQLVRVIYDFKTDRLVAAWQPSGEISGERAIHADVMFVREHQGDIAQLTFTEGGAITEINTAYAVMRFNKWTINNKSKADGHAVLNPLLSRYERDLFYVSFPFRVSMNEVFGFGTYGKHWIIEYYDGATRAEKGYWLESGPNWKFVTDRRGKYFEPNQGYIIALELDELGEESDVWDNDVQNVELYFPSYGDMGDITNATVNCTIPEHLCTINRSAESNGNGGTLGSAYDRRVKDSHWNVISVPTYVNTNNLTFANTDWITTADETHVGPNFLYEWNSADNTVTARSGIGYTYKAMHAYLVQYCGAISWTSSVTPAAAPRRNPAYRGEYEFRLEMMQNDQVVDQTYVKLSDDEHVTTGFEFNYDLSKEFNSNKSNIYTLIGTEQVAGNVLPLTDQTTVVPVGVVVKTDGDYTFSMPDGTEGIGITLIDNETGIRTSLGALDYTINMSAGTYEERFVLEISPIKPIITGIDQLQMANDQSPIKKILIDGLLYIVKDGKMFDAQGRQVK